MSDGIEMHVRAWVQVEAESTTIYFRVCDRRLLLLTLEGEFARVDGGDGGDEDERCECERCRKAAAS